MKRLFQIALFLCLAATVHALDTIYRGDSTDAKDVICYYQGSKFYADQQRKEALYTHPGNIACKGADNKPANALYRFMSGHIYKGFSIKKEDALATIVETKTFKGNTVEAKIYEGFAIARDFVNGKGEKGYTVYDSYKITRDAVNVTDVPVLFTISNGKIYKGDSTKAEDCVLSFTGNFNASRVLFMAIHLTQK